MQVDPLNNRTNKLIPYFVVDDSKATVDFYVRVFDATGVKIMEYDGKVIHAELTIGTDTIMLSDEMHGMLSAKSIGDTPVSMYLYVVDVDRVFNKAVELGAKITMAIENQFYGDRTGAFIDPFGFKWTIATHIVDLSSDTMMENYEKMLEEHKYKQKYEKYKIKYHNIKQKN